MPAAIKDTRPAWMNPDNASVFDSGMVQAMRKIASVLGLNSPDAPITAMMAPMEVGPSGGLMGAVQKFIKAYHGSPHDFERFDMSKIGTGEGAQAYGHGLYFAENPGVAGSYKTAGASYLNPNVMTLAQDALREAGQGEGQIARARNILYPRYQQETDPIRKRMMQDAYNNIEPIAQGKTGGKMYEVAIKADPEQFLDWDKPVRQQAQPVKQALREKGITGKRWDVQAVGESNKPEQPGWSEAGKTYNDRYVFENPVEARKLVQQLRGEGVEARPIHSTPWRGEVTGREAYEAIAPTRSSEDASQALKSAGIPGIKYLDQGSRNVQLLSPEETTHKQWLVKQIPNGNVYYRGPDEAAARAAYEQANTHNYVVFDDKLVDILKKYGIPIAAAMKAVESQQRTQQQ